MSTKVIFRRFWLLILAIPLCLYVFFCNENFDSLISTIGLTLFLVIYTQLKTEKLRQTSVLVVLISLIIWQIIVGSIQQHFHFYKIVLITAAIFITLILTSTKGINKVKELGDNKYVQNIIIALFCGYLCFSVVEREPNDILEYALAFVSGIISLVFGWFALYDFNNR